MESSSTQSFFLLLLMMLLRDSPGLLCRSLIYLEIFVPLFKDQTNAWTRVFARQGIMGVRKTRKPAHSSSAFIAPGKSTMDREGRVRTPFSCCSTCSAATDTPVLPSAFSRSRCHQLRTRDPAGHWVFSVFGRLTDSVLVISKQSLLFAFNRN